MDVLSFFRVELEQVGRIWCDIIAQHNEYTAKRRPGLNTNHVLWLTGHMIWAEDFLIVEVPSSQFYRKKEWDALFDHSSEKLPDDRYPSFDAVRNEYYRVHGEVMKFLAALKPIDLNRPTSIERRWFPTAAHSIGHAVTHSPYHLGQLTILERMRQANIL